MLEKIAGQPAHPIFVHFPVAFLTLASFLVGLHAMDRGGRVNRWLKKIGLGSFDFKSFSLLALILGLMGAIFAISSGLALVRGWNNAPIPHAPLGIGTTTCYFILLILRWVFGPSIDTSRAKWLYYGLHLLGVLLIILTGFEGGELHSH